MDRKYRNPLTVFRRDEILPIGRFYSGQHESIVWLHLDKRYSGAPGFWNLFFCVVMHLNDACLLVLSQDPPPWEESEMEEKLSRFMESVNLPEPCTLVFENIHLLSKGAAMIFLNLMYQHPLENMRIIFLSDTLAEISQGGNTQHYTLNDPALILTKEQIRIYLLAHGKLFEETTLSYLCHICQYRYTNLIKILQQVAYNNDNLTMANVHHAAEKLAM